MSGDWQLSAVALADAFEQGASDPERHLALLQQRIDRLDPRLNAFVAVDPQACTAARDSATRWREGRARSRLDGVPVAIKDNILVRGLPCAWGSRVFRDYVPDEDELPVARLRAAGAVILGKTNVPEFTLEGITWNPVFGATRNPWNPRLTPGGSSGGSVAAVSAGLVPLALGTDGGGSIRRPAAHTGLVALKPSIGAVPRGPSLPNVLLDCEVIGPIARSVADARLLLEVIAGPDASDQSSLRHALQPTERAAMRAAAAPLRALYVERFGDAPLDPEIAASAAATVARLEGLGVRVARGPLPLDLRELDAFWSSFGAVGLAHVMAAHPGREALLGARMQELLVAGRGVPAARYLAWIEAMQALRRAAAQLFTQVDLVLTPTTAALPWEAETPFPAIIDGRAATPRGHAIYTAWVNACGHPALSVPCAPSRAGLPIGLQLVGAFGADALLLDVARQLEAVDDWTARWPALAYD